MSWNPKEVCFFLWFLKRWLLWSCLIWHLIHHGNLFIAWLFFIWTLNKVLIKSLLIVSCSLRYVASGQSWFAALQHWATAFTFPATLCLIFVLWLQWIINISFGSVQPEGLTVTLNSWQACLINRCLMFTPDHPQSLWPVQRHNDVNLLFIWSVQQLQSGQLLSGSA